MKKIFKSVLILSLFLLIFPALASLAVMELWNSIMPAVCGFAAISFGQSAGLFVMGQILTGGVLLAVFLVGAAIHHAAGHRHGEWREHLHNMTEEQRREFIERRRREHSGFHNRQNRSEDAAK